MSSWLAVHPRFTRLGPSAVATRPVGSVGGPVSTTLETSTETVADVPLLPAASWATATSSCVPLATVRESQDSTKGAVLSVARVCPSTCRSTEVTPMSSAAVTETSTVPLTVAPAEGDVIDAVGGAESTPGLTSTTSCGRSAALDSLDRNAALLLDGDATRRLNTPSPVTREDRSTSYQLSAVTAPSLANGVRSAAGWLFQFMVLSLHDVSATRAKSPP